MSVQELVSHVSPEQGQVLSTNPPSFFSPQVAGGPSPSPTVQQTLELDSCVDSSMLGSSFLTFSGLRAEVRAEPLKAEAGANLGPGKRGPLPLRVLTEDALYFPTGLHRTGEK